MGGSIIAGAILFGWYWSEALAERTYDTVLQARFAPSSNSWQTLRPRLWQNYLPHRANRSI